REARLVHRLEGQRTLKACFGCGLDLSGGFEPPRAIQFRPIATKTQRATGRPAPPARLFRPGLAREAVTAIGAQHPRTPAFELTTRKDNPFFVSRLQKV